MTRTKIVRFVGNWAQTYDLSPGLTNRMAESNIDPGHTYSNSMDWYNLSDDTYYSYGTRDGTPYIWKVNPDTLLVTQSAALGTFVPWDVQGDTIIGYDSGSFNKVFWDAVSLTQTMSVAASGVLASPNSLFFALPGQRALLMDLTTGPNAIGVSIVSRVGPTSYSNSAYIGLDDSASYSFAEDATYQRPYIYDGDKVWIYAAAGLGGDFMAGDIMGAVVDCTNITVSYILAPGAGVGSQDAFWDPVANIMVAIYSGSPSGVTLLNTSALTCLGNSGAVGGSNYAGTIRGNSVLMTNFSSSDVDEFSTVSPSSTPIATYSSTTTTTTNAGDFQAGFSFGSSRPIFPARVSQFWTKYCRTTETG